MTQASVGPTLILSTFINVELVKILFKIVPLGVSEKHTFKKIKSATHQVFALGVSLKGFKRIFDYDDV